MMVYLTLESVEREARSCNTSKGDHTWTVENMLNYPLEVKNRIRLSYPEFSVVNDLFVTGDAYSHPDFDRVWRLLTFC